jgi:predicted Zn-dependent peptidase
MIEKTVLPNGLRVATIKIPTISTSIGIFVGAGAINENRDKEYGLSHFLEHMAFKGTPSRDSNHIAREIEYSGGHTNAYTSYSHTAYYANVLKEDIYKTLEILIDSTYNSIFPEKEIEVERNVIKQEIARYNDSQEDIAYYNFQKAIYGDQPLGSNIIGTPESLDLINRSDFIRYVNTWYTANNSIIVGSGDINHKTFVEEVARLTGTLTHKPVSKIQSSKYIGGYQTFNRDFEQINFLLGLEGSAYTDFKKSQGSKLLANYLGGGMSSPLFKEVREARGLVYEIGAFASSYRESGVFGVGGGTTPENMIEVIKVTLNEIEKIITDFDEDNFVRAKNQTKMGLGRMQESSGSLMKYVGSNWLCGDDHLYSFDHLLGSLNDLTENDMKELAEELLKSKKSFSLVGPITTEISDFIKDLTA